MPTVEVTLAQAIRLGQHDEELADIKEAVTDRRKALARDNARALRPGDTVHFNDTIRPRYMVGLPATVVRVNQESVAVSCPDDPKYGKYQGSQNVRCPNTLIEELS